MIYDALVAARVSPNRTARFASCGAGFWVMRKRDDHRSVKVVQDCCHDRFCDPCGTTRRFIIRTNLESRIQPHPHRLLTLTVRNEGIRLTDLLDRLLRSFKKLRASTFWRERVRGGAAFIEVTANEKTGRWHPHLHCIIDGKFLDQAVLRKLWLAVTGDSFVLDIRLIHQQHDVCKYITKYATKPLHAVVVRHGYLLEEAIDALRGRKLCYTFGAWSRWPLLRMPGDEEWETVCHSNELPSRIYETDDYADQIHAHLEAHINRGGPMTFETTTT